MLLIGFACLAFSSGNASPPAVEKNDAIPIFVADISQQMDVQTISANDLSIPSIGISVVEIKRSPGSIMLQLHVINCAFYQDRLCILKNLRNDLTICHPLRC